MTEEEYMAIVSTTLHTIETAMNAVDAQSAFAHSLAIAVTDLYRTAIDGIGLSPDEIAKRKEAFLSDIGEALYMGIGGWNVEYGEEATK